MNDKNKRLWENSLDLLDEEIIGESAQTLYKKSLTDFNENDLVIVETEKKSKFPIFALVASIVAIIGVAVITGVIIANTGIFTTPLESEDESNITSEIEDDENILIPQEMYLTDSGMNLVSVLNTDFQVVKELHKFK